MWLHLQGAFQCGAFSSTKLLEATYASGDTPNNAAMPMSIVHSVLAMQVPSSTQKCMRC